MPFKVDSVYENVYIWPPKIFFSPLRTLPLFRPNENARYNNKLKYVVKDKIVERGISLKDVRLNKCIFLRYLLLRHGRFRSHLFVIVDVHNRIAFGLHLYWTAPTVLAREMCVIKVDRLYTRKRAFPSKASLCNRTKFRIERADMHLTAFWTSNYSVCLSRTIQYCNPIYMNNKSV